MNIYISAVLSVKESCIFEAIEILKKLVIETRKEEGCIFYDLIEDHNDKGTFFIMEQWENADFLKLHQSSEHMLIYKQNIANLLEKETKVFIGNKLF